MILRNGLVAPHGASPRSQRLSSIVRQRRLQGWLMLAVALPSSMSYADVDERVKPVPEPPICPASASSMIGYPNDAKLMRAVVLRRANDSRDVPVTVKFLDLDGAVLHKQEGQLSAKQRAVVVELRPDQFQHDERTLVQAVVVVGDMDVTRGVYPLQISVQTVGQSGTTETIETWPTEPMPYPGGSHGVWPDCEDPTQFPYANP